MRSELVEETVCELVGVLKSSRRTRKDFLLKERSVGTWDDGGLSVLRERIRNIADLFHFVVDAAWLKRIELETSPRLDTIEGGLVEDFSSARLSRSCDVVHDLER